MNKLAYVALLLTATILFAWIFIQYWPITVIVPNTQPYKVLTKKVKVGEQLIYLVDACKKIAVPSVVSRSFVDGVTYPSITSINNVSVGCGRTKVSILVPNFIVPGVYHVVLNIQYKINPLRTDTYHFKTETFEVLPEASSSATK